MAREMAISAAIKIVEALINYSIFKSVLKCDSLAPRIKNPKEIIAYVLLKYEYPEL